jgi:hypothetical protein
MKGKPFFWGGIGLFLCLAAVAAACWLLTGRWAASPRSADRIGGPESEARWNARAPRLQVHAPGDLRRLRAEQKKALHENARIPIEQAMALIGSGRDYFPAKPVSPEAMRQSRAMENPAAATP